MTLSRPVLGNHNMPRLFHSFALNGWSGLTDVSRSWSGQPSGQPDLRVSRAWTWQNSAQPLINYAYRLKTLKENAPEDSSEDFWSGLMRPSTRQPVSPVVSQPVAANYSFDAASSASLPATPHIAEPVATFNIEPTPAPYQRSEIPTESLAQLGLAPNQFEPDAAIGNRPAENNPPGSPVSELSNRAPMVRVESEQLQLLPITPSQAIRDMSSRVGDDLQVPAKEAFRPESMTIQPAITANDFMAGLPGSMGLALLADLLTTISGNTGGSGLDLGLGGPGVGIVESYFEPALFGYSGPMSILNLASLVNLPGMAGQGSLVGLQRMFRQLDFARREPFAHFNNLTGQTPGNPFTRPAVYSPLYQPNTSFVVRQNPVVSRTEVEEGDFWDQYSGQSPLGQLPSRATPFIERVSSFPTSVSAMGSYELNKQVERTQAAVNSGQAATPSPIEAAQETLVRLVSQAAFSGEPERANIANLPYLSQLSSGETLPLPASLERLGLMLSGTAGGVVRNGPSGGLFPATRLPANFGPALANLPAGLAQLIYRQNPAAFANFEPNFSELIGESNEPFRVAASVSNLTQADAPRNYGSGYIPANVSESGVVSSPFAPMVDQYQALAGLNAVGTGLPGQLTGFGTFNAPAVPTRAAEGPVQVYRQTVPASGQAETGFAPGFYDPFQMMTGTAGSAKGVSFDVAGQPRNVERGLPGATGREFEHSATTLQGLKPMVAPRTELFGLETAAEATNTAFVGTNSASVENSPTLTFRQNVAARFEVEAEDAAFESENETALFPASQPKVTRPIPAAEAYSDWPVLRAIEPLTRETPGVAAPTPATTEPFAVTVLRQRSPIQRQAAIAALHTLPSLGPGEGLTAEVRQSMETLIGHDLRTVRVYSSPVASELGVEAFTSGERVVFAPGRLDYRSHTGLALLGHELTHIGQPLGFKTSTAMPGGDLEEQEAVTREAEIEQLIARGWPSAPQMEVRKAAQGLAMLVESGGEVRGPQQDNGFVSGEYSPAFDGGNNVSPTTGSSQVARPESENLPTANLSEVARSESFSPAASAAPDLKNIARQVYAILKGRLKAERDRRKMY